MIGTLLSHYRVVERLGAGGMGVVYKAVDERLQRDVAIKVLPEGMLRNDEARRRFRHEARAAARIIHPHISTVLDFESAGSADFLVMEYVPGESLDDVIARGALPEQTALGLGEQIADALEALHELGVLHCDLKPGNVIVTPRGQAKLFDFGLARPMRDPDAATRTSGQHTIVGTLPYLAPEQIEGRPLDGRVDLHALGVLLYEMATGQRAFAAAEPAALLYAIVNTEPPPPRTLRPELTPAFEALIARATQKRPNRRFTSAHEMKLAIAAVRAGAAPAPAARADEVSLAVLPLANLSSDPEQEFFADGMTEALIADLAQIAALSVISRTSVMPYRGKSEPLPEIARALGVKYVLEGSVLRAGGRVRINAQLIEASGDRHVWAKSYERPLDDVLALQAEVSRAIADEVRVQLTPRERERLIAPRGLNPAAYDAYLRGRHFWNQRSAASLPLAIEQFREAIETAPNDALAWSGLADCYNVLGVYRWREPAETFPRAKTAALRSIEIDPELAEGHSSLAFATQYWDWDWPAARAGYERALRLHPGYATGRQWYADFLSAMGEADLSISEARRAVQSDPLSPVMGTSVGDALYYARRYGEAVIEYRRTGALDPHFPWARMNLARTFQELGRYEEAVVEFERTIVDLGFQLEDSPAMAYAYAVGGHRADAERILARLLDPAREAHAASYAVATVFVGLGDRDRAFEWLERALEERDRMMVLIKVHPRLDPIRDDARFARLMTRVGFAG